METHANNGLRQIKAFASDAGVSVRTLHLYDRLGLLAPAAHSDSGYRLYGDAELERLEQILALRFIGLRLDQIRELLAGSAQPLAVALHLQRGLIARQKRRLEDALSVIEKAQQALANDASADRLHILRTLMEVFKMQNDFKWTQNYYSQGALEKIEENRRALGDGVIEQGERDWPALIAEVEQAVTAAVDPAGDRAQALAARWRALIAQFTQGDPEISRGLKSLWSNQTHWPTDFKRPWSDAADAFIKKAMNCS